MIKKLLGQTWNNATLARIAMNSAIFEYTKKNNVKGATIDLGSKSGDASHNRFMTKAKDCKITYTDLHPQSDKVKKLDLEKHFGIQDEVYDTVLCFNVLEHLYDYKNAVTESYRILKKGGVFIGATPFLVHYHPDPNDYFRYTDSAIEKIFTGAGFAKEEITPLGLGPITSGNYSVIMLMPRILRLPSLVIAIICDKFLNLITRNRHSGAKYPLMYFFVFKK